MIYGIVSKQFFQKQAKQCVKSNNSSYFEGGGDGSKWKREQDFWDLDSVLFLNRGLVHGVFTL